MQKPQDVLGWLDDEDQKEKRKHLNPRQFPIGRSNGPLMAGGYPMGLAAGWMFERPAVATDEIIGAPNGTPESIGGAVPAE